jgi:hypothetical protein
VLMSYWPTTVRSTMRMTLAAPLASRSYIPQPNLLTYEADASCLLSGKKATEYERFLPSRTFLATSATWHEKLLYTIRYIKWAIPSRRESLNDPL